MEPSTAIKLLFQLIDIPVVGTIDEPLFPLDAIFRVLGKNDVNMAIIRMQNCEEDLILQFREISDDDCSKLLDSPENSTTSNILVGSLTEQDTMNVSGSGFKTDIPSSFKISMAGYIKLVDESELFRLVSAIGTAKAIELRRNIILILDIIRKLPTGVELNSKYMQWKSSKSLK